MTMIRSPSMDRLLSDVVYVQDLAPEMDSYAYPPSGVALVLGSRREARAPPAKADPMLFVVGSAGVLRV